MDFQRIFIFLGLAVTGYFLILTWQQDYGATTATEGTPSIAQEEMVLGGSIPSAPAESDSSIPELSTIPTMPLSAVSPTTQMPSQPLISVQTDVFRARINPVGGDIVSISLPAFPATLEQVDEPLQLVSDFNRYQLQSGLIGPDGIDKAGNRPVFQAAQVDYELSGRDELRVELTPSLDGESDLSIQKVYLFRSDDYLVDVSYEIENRGYTPKTMAFFGQIKRDGQPPREQDSNFMTLQPFIGGATRREDERYFKIDLEDLNEAPYQYDFTGGYIAFLQHYFLTAWVPFRDQTVRYFGKPAAGSAGLYTIGYTAAPVTIAPGERVELGGQLYMGPKDQPRLASIAEGLDLTVDYGFLWFIAQPLFSGLTWIFDWVGNWGVAIILLTVCVKILLYPLSAASFKSMARMRKLQPEMVRLRDRYGEDRQKLGQAMMDLYKKEKVNPLGGCFPILLQMPVFLALYWTLMESVELRQAPFIGWITDLSAMDPYFVLPILMGISMYLTQMMQPEPPDPIQAKVFKFMPVMFTFFFLWFPSGLVLYWLVNNILSVLQQLYVTRQIELGRD
jgi:YidC/Oxa1 family membrane protein insertase